MSITNGQDQGRIKKPNRQAKKERKKKKGRMAGVAGAGNKRLARIIHEKSQKIKKRNARFPK